jgi:membrane-associated phospholipid phosphatase
MLKVCALAVALILVPAAAHAADDEPRPSTLEWSPLWPRFRSWEYGGTLALGLGALALNRAAAPPAEARLAGGWLFDGFAREHLRAGTPGGRARARRTSDVLLWSGVAMPFLVDAPIALGRRRPDIAGQLVLMNLEAFAISSFTTRALKIGIGRARPGRELCGGPLAGEYACDTDDSRSSLPSGHASFAATAAGLTCVHHRYLPLWGSPTADAGACALMVAAALATGTARVVGDRHYATDVLLGSALGFGIGYGTPWLLHYRAGRRDENAGATLLPMVGDDRLGAAVVGAF